jgi:hypothetical protein
MAPAFTALAPPHGAADRAPGADDFHNWSGVAAETAAALPKIVRCDSLRWLDRVLLGSCIGRKQH